MRKVSSVIVLLLLFPLAPASWAHHSRANFQLTETIEIRGTVTRYTWTSPHIYINIDRMNDQGVVEDWLLEGQAIPMLTRLGWDRNSLKPGDKIVATGNPNRDPAKRFIYAGLVIKEDGTELSLRPQRGRQQGPRTVSAVTPSTDFTGVWAPDRGSNRQGAQGAQGGLVFAAPVGLPLTPKGQAQLDRSNLDDDPFNRCVSPAVPRIITGAFDLRVTREDEQIIFDQDANPIRRVIHLDQETHSEDTQRTRQGHSIGRFEDGEFIIDTAYFVEDKWGLARGVDSGLDKRVLERYSLIDGGLGMKVEYTITDPEYLTEPLILSRQWRKGPDHEFSHDECDLEAAARYLTR